MAPSRSQAFRLGELDAHTLSRAAIWFAAILCALSPWLSLDQATGTRCRLCHCAPLAEIVLGCRIPTRRRCGNRTEPPAFAVV
jgi:hypothetical protein